VSSLNPTDALSRVFGHRGFRGQQQAIVDHVLAGRHALVIMPTGGGIDIRTHADPVQHSCRPTSAPMLHRFYFFYSYFSSSFFYLSMG
jgi:hypothetical protein